MASTLSNNTAAIDRKQRLEDAANFINTVARWKVLDIKAARRLRQDDPLISATWFTKGCPAHCVREVLELLSAQHKVSDPVIGGHVLSGDWYHRRAYWRRDGQTDERGDNTMTLIRTMGPKDDMFAHVTEYGCTTTSSIEFHWDVVDIEEAPPQRQGFSRQIGGLNRNQEDNTFSYYIATTEQHTFHDTEKLVGSNKFETTYIEKWTGLRGTKDAPVLDTGESVSIPNPASQSKGTTVTVQWQHDDTFCTWSATIQTVETKKDIEGPVSCEQNQYQHSDSTTTMAQTSKLGHAPKAKDGKTVSHRSAPRPDSLFDNTVGESLELPVEDAQVSTRKDLFTEQTSVVHQHQADDPPEASAGGGVIVSVSSKKTPGKLRDNSVDTVKELTVDEAQMSIASDLFGKQKSVTNRAKPGPAEAVDPGGGLSGSVSNEKTPGGLVHQQISTREEATVEDAQVSVDVNLFGKQTRKTTKSSPNAPPAASTGGGRGTGVQTARTPGDLKDITIVEDEEFFVQGAQESRQATIFEYQSSSHDANSPSAALAASASGGIMVSTQVSRTPRDRKNVHTTRVQELPVPNATLDTTGDKFQKTESVMNANVPDPGPAPSVNPEQGTLFSRSRAKTPGGLTRVTNRETKFVSAKKVRESKNGDLISNQESYTDINQNSIPDVDTGFVGFGEPIKSRQYEETGAGQFNVTINTDTPGPFREYTITARVPYTAPTLYEYFVNFVNAKQEDLNSIVLRYPDHRPVPGYQWNRFGLMQGSIHFVPYINPGGPDGVSEYRLKGLHEDDITLVMLNDGNWYYRRTTMYYDLVRGQGVRNGRQDYNGALTGSHFHVMSASWYDYKKVTSIKITHTKTDVKKEIIITAESKGSSTSEGEPPTSE